MSDKILDIVRNAIYSSQPQLDSSIEERIRNMKTRRILQNAEKRNVEATELLNAEKRTNAVSGTLSKDDEDFSSIFDD